jgi:hypothetical protein
MAIQSGPRALGLKTFLNGEKKGFKSSEVWHMFLNCREQIELLSTAHALLQGAVVKSGRIGSRPGECESFYGLVTSEA